MSLYCGLSGGMLSSRPLKAIPPAARLADSQVSGLIMLALFHHESNLRLFTDSLCFHSSETHLTISLFKKDVCLLLLLLALLQK